MPTRVDEIVWPVHPWLHETTPVVEADFPMNVVKILNKLSHEDQKLVRSAVPMRNLTTLRVGGPATLVCSIHTPEQAVRFHALAQENQIPVFILGGGSNVLADDRGFHGIVLKVANENLHQKNEVITVGAGLDFDQLIARTLDLGLTGLEFASGIPGTVGGALVGNAGCYGHEIGEFLIDAQVLTPEGTVQTMGPEAFGFRYRETDLRESGHVLLEARLRLEKGDVPAAAKSRLEKIADRRAKHPGDLPSAGSWFRNLPATHPGARRQAAGMFLEKAGAKDMREGGAYVFAKHANMIINGGHATSDDVLKLAARMKKVVAEQFQLTLIEEVRYLTDTDDQS